MLLLIFLQLPSRRDGASLQGDRESLCLLALVFVPLSDSVLDAVPYSFPVPFSCFTCVSLPASTVGR